MIYPMPLWNALGNIFGAQQFDQPFPFISGTSHRQRNETALFISAIESVSLLPDIQSPFWNQGKIRSKVNQHKNPFMLNNLGSSPSALSIHSNSPWILNLKSIHYFLCTSEGMLWIVSKIVFTFVLQFGAKIGQFCGHPPPNYEVITTRLQGGLWGFGISWDWGIRGYFW